MYKIKEEPEDDEKEKNECFLEFVPVVKIEHQIKKENEEISEFESRRSDSDMKNVALKNEEVSNPFQFVKLENQVFPHEDDYQIKREEDLVHTDNTCLVVHKKLKKEEEPRTRALGSENTNVAAENAKSSLCSNKSLNSGSELMHPDESYSHLESSSQNSSQMPNVSDGNGNSSCEICGLSISGTALLKNQTSEHSLSCDHCKKLFSNTKTLKRFIKSTEVGERSYLCALCSKSFRRISDLKSHMRTHTGERPYSCTICHKTFSRSGSLRSHKVIHTGELPFSCDQCDKSFSNDSNLKRHMRTHTGERPFACTVCGKSFSQSGNLKLHMVSHTDDHPFSCDNCGKSFSNISYLSSHLRTHSGERPFSCNVCNKSFSQRRTLQVHMQTHTGDRPFSCDICAKSFAHFNSLKRHLRGHHSQTDDRPFSNDKS